MRFRWLTLLLCISALAAGQEKVNIHRIQSFFPHSPEYEHLVTTEGIVTVVLKDGFYIENSYETPWCLDPTILNCWDNDNTTAEGVFVYTGTTPDPSYATVGDLVSVTGNVVHSNSSADPDTQGFEIETSAPPTRVDDVTYALPPTIAADVFASAPTGKFGQWLEFSGMRVEIASLLVTSATSGTQPTATQPAVSTGQFWGVMGDSSASVARPFRDTGISVLEPVPSTAPPTVSRWSANPSLLFIASTSRGGPPLDVAANDVVKNLVGIVDYHENALGYTGILLDPSNGYGSVTPGPTTNGTPAAAPSTIQSTIATLDLDNFYDTSTISSTAFNARVDKAALATVQFLSSPDILAVQQVQSMEALNTLAAQIAADGGPTYTPCWFQGNDQAGLASGFLVNESKITVISCDQVDATKTYSAPGGASTPLFDRPPLVLTAGIQRKGGPDYQVIIVNTELLDRTNIDDSNSGSAVRARRAAESEEISSIVEGYQSSGKHVVALGDFHSFEFSDGFVDTMGAIVGNPVAPSLVTLPVSTVTNPAIVNLTTQPANTADNRYTFVENGSAEQTDHILVSSDLASMASLAYARIGADFPVIDLNDDTTALHASSHDGLVLYLTIPFPAQIALISSANPSAYGQAVTFTATATGSAGTPTGTMTFYDGSTVMCNSQAMTGGVASCVASALSVGRHTIKAVYSGDSTYESATATLVQTVDPTPSTVVLTSAPNPSYFGQVVTLAAVVSGARQAPTGTVTFNDLTTGAVLGSATVANGSGAINIGTLAVGSHTIQAAYSGDLTNASGQSNQIVQVVLTLVQSSTLACAPNPAAVGATVTCTDILASAGGTPAGTVTFNDSNTPLGTAPLNAGTAVYSTSTLTAGTHPIVAVYPGSPQSTPSTSNTFNEIILPSFSIAISPSSQIIYTGQPATYTVTVTPDPGSTVDVALSCSDLPAATTCTFTPATVPGGGGISKLIVQTSAPANTNTSGRIKAESRGLPLLAVMLFLFVPRRFRRRGWWVIVLLAGLATGVMNGCGGSGTLTGGTVPGSYTITVTGAAVNSPAPVIKSTTASLKVNSLF